MIKKGVLFVLGLLFVATILTGCVSQKDYDAMVKESDETITQLMSLQTNLDEIKSNYSNYKSDTKIIADLLVKEVKALSHVNSYMVTISQLTNTELVIDSSGIQAITRVDISDLILLEGAALKFQADFGAAINDIGDASLIQGWTEYEVALKMKDDEAKTKLNLVIDMLNKSLNDNVEALETILNTDKLY